MSERQESGWSVCHTRPEAIAPRLSPSRLSRVPTVPASTGTSLPGRYPKLATIYWLPTPTRSSNRLVVKSFPIYIKGQAKKSHQLICSFVFLFVFAVSLWTAGNIIYIKHNSQKSSRTPLLSFSFVRKE
jgi:hypothetical protein